MCVCQKLKKKKTPNQTAATAVQSDDVGVMEEGEKEQATAEQDDCEKDDPLSDQETVERETGMSEYIYMYVHLSVWEVWVGG